MLLVVIFFSIKEYDNQDNTNENKNLPGLKT